jgi:hypothetical protein
MPNLDLVDVGPTDSFVLKNSGVTVVMRRHSTGADHDEAMNATIGEGYNPRHAYVRYLRYMAAALVVSWDATQKDEEGKEKPIPVTPQTLAAMKDEADYSQLLNEAGKRVQLRGEQDAENFDQSSSPSSEATSSKTPTNTRRSTRTSATSS